MICENCGCYHDGNYASGRFCSSACSHSYSSKVNNSKRIANITSSSSHDMPSRPKVKYNKVENYWLNYIKSNYPELAVESQVKISNPDIMNNNHYYRLDFLVNNKFNIEIDGYHPDNRDTSVRDSYLNSIGINVIRVKYINPSRSPLKVNTIIDEVIKKIMQVSYNG